MLRCLRPLAVFIGLAACVSFGAGGVQSLALSGGAITAKGPEGYCINVSESRPLTGFAALVRCPSPTQNPDATAVTGLITIQVGGRNSATVTGSEDELARLLGSRAGATLLAGNGDPNTVIRDSVAIEGDVVFVHFTDTATPVVDGLEQEEWRAFLDLRGRLITVGVRGFATTPLSRTDGLQLLSRAVNSLRNANKLDTVIETDG